MTSDEAFEKIKMMNKKFDIIFIDGLHISEQVTKDIYNSLDVLSSNGIIVLHDCNPPSAMHARNPPPNPINCPWNGDCYKSIIKFKYENPTIFTSVIDTDWGVGIIDPSKPNILPQISVPETLIPNNNDYLVGGPIQLNNLLTWDYFNLHRTELLNLISVVDFLTA